MSQHLSQTQLVAYNDRTLYPDELLTVDTHLATCDECHERLTRMAPAVGRRTASPALESGQGAFHLDYEQHLEPYVEGKASDIEREIVDSHVAFCSPCAAELRDLLEFKQQPVAAATGDIRTTSGGKQRFPYWSLLPNPAWAMAAVVAVFVLVIAFLFWMAYPTSRRVEQAATIPPTPDQPKQGPETDEPSPSASVQSGRTDPSSTPSLEPGSIQPAPPSEQRRIVVYDANGQLVLTQRGRLEGMEDLPPDLRESVERALVTSRLPASPALSGFYPGASNNMRGGDIGPPTEFAPVEPTNIVVESDRPEFRWRALDAAQDYTVTIYDSNSRQVATSGPVTGTAWTASTPLARGVTYSWQISALKGGERVVSPKPPLPEARFKILDQAAVSTLAKLRQTFGTSRLVMGIFYWKHGLIPESEREFQALAKANPKSAVVKALLANVRSIRDG